MAWTTPVTQTTGTLITAAIWNAQVTDNMSYLKAFGTGMIAMFDVACPTGWTRVSAWDGKFVRGAAAYGGTGGADSHTHAQNMDTSGTGSLTDNARVMATSGSNVVMAATTMAGASTMYAAKTGVVSADSRPAYIEVIFCKKD